MAEYKGVMVYCEAGDGKLAPIATELLGAGSRLANDLGQELSAVLIGSGVAGLAKEAIAYGAKKVYVVEDPLLKDYVTDSYLAVMDKVIKQASPQIVLLGQTQTGRDLTPRLAFRLDTAATMDCIALGIDPASKRLLMTKPVYGGNAQAIMVCQIDPQIATVRSKAMTPATREDSRQGEVINIAAGIDPASVRTRLVERKIEAAAGVKLEDAHVIVSGGRGIGGPDGFKQLEELARVLKGAMGASRPPCDNKWVPDTVQIGLTGKIVSPDLYIAVALSGSSQHLSGCSGSKVIVAINKDAEANIFKVAHYGVVGDWKKVLPAFTAKVKELIG
ncbi:MAG: Electron transfer flavoprotein alpha/beta-subunit [Chloroflexi bacterium]|nr:Electron transfer flavoprotein alpha/beta-subunit [Chloroflexota bacterium]